MLNSNITTYTKFTISRMVSAFQLQAVTNTAFLGVEITVILPMQLFSGTAFVPGEFNCWILKVSFHVKDPEQKFGVRQIVVLEYQTPSELNHLKQ